MPIGDTPFAVFRVEITEEEFIAARGARTLEEALADDRDTTAPQRYIYTAVMDDKTCQLCAPYHGVETTGGEPGEMSDEGVPNPPTHEFCRCRLVPVEVADAQDDPAAPMNEDHASWLRDLPRGARDAVVGKVRSALIEDGLVSASDLYGEDGRLRTLESLGFNSRGQRLRRR